ncbi:MAG: AEC family transporter [Oscillibacter sp.]|jgi:predicted permease|nr:AEC family transporter [Oscillibacter sp.]
MSFFDTLTEMLVLLFTIAMGFTANRLGILGGETDQKISKLLLCLTLPAMLLGSVCTGDALPETSVVLGTLGVAVVFYSLEFAFVLAVPPLLGGTPGQRGVWRYTLAFPNVAFIGYPVVTALFGAEALFYAVILVLPFNLMTFTLGPLLLTGAKRFSLRQMLSPCVLASALALGLALLRLRPPAVVGEALNFMGNITVPLSLLFVGSLLAGIPLGRMLASPRLWILTAVRLLVLPAVLCFLLRRMGTEPLILGVAVIQMAMPTAMNGSLLCMEYGGDAECMAQITFVSTLASIVTIPILAASLL